MIQIFGKYATKNILDLSKERTKTIIEGFDLELAFSLEKKSLPYPKETNYNEITDGYVILKYKNFFLGCGLLKNGKLKNMIPKAKRIRVDLL